MALSPASSRGGAGATAPLVLSNVDANDVVLTLNGKAPGGGNFFEVYDTPGGNIQGYWDDSGTVLLGQGLAVYSGGFAASKFTATSSGLSFFGGGPAAQPAAIADAAGGAVQDTQARAALNALLAAMRACGFIAT